MLYAPSYLVLHYIPSLVCAVCIDGYARGLGYTCLECSERRRVVAIAITVVILVIIIIIIILRSFENRFSSQSLARLRTAKAFQALKIIFVVWQIVTQARRDELHFTFQEQDYIYSFG